jgi:hypothetical protein
MLAARVEQKNGVTTRDKNGVIQGVSHAEWPKNNDEYTPPPIGEAIC